MNLFDYLAGQKPHIASYIEDFFEEKIKTVSKEYAHLYETLRDFSLKGKLLRGCLLLLSYEMAGGKDIEFVIPAAVAVEINQSALLIHDDIMDNDLLRRGVPSVHAHYIKEGKRIGAFSPKHYGIGTGIIVGDLAIFLGYELLDRATLKPKARTQVFQEYAQDMQHTTIGQVMDFNFSSTPYEPNEEEILKMYRFKTARYSIVNPFLMGAYAANAKEDYAKTLSALCEKLGIMFQIKDDVIGLLGDEKITGKPASSDIKENKKTLLWKYLFDATPDDKKNWLRSTFGNQNISQDDFQELVAYIKKSEVQEKINTKLRMLADEAQSDIDKLAVSDAFKGILKELVHYSLTRDK